MNDYLIIALFLGVIVIVLFVFHKPINELFGGYDKCFICQPLHTNGYLSNWTVSHFVAFLIVGYLAPKRINFIIFLGVAWEFMELYMEYVSKTKHRNVLNKILHLDCSQKLTEKQFWQHYFGIRKLHEKKTLFWCSGGFLGSILDIVADILGVLTGAYLSRKFNKRLW